MGLFDSSVTPPGVPQMVPLEEGKKDPKKTSTRELHGIITAFHSKDLNYTGLNAEYDVIYAITPRGVWIWEPDEDDGDEEGEWVLLNGYYREEETEE